MPYCQLSLDYNIDIEEVALISGHGGLRRKNNEKDARGQVWIKWNRGEESEGGKDEVWWRNNELEWEEKEESRRAYNSKVYRTVRNLQQTVCKLQLKIDIDDTEDMHMKAQ